MQYFKATLAIVLLIIITAPALAQMLTPELSLTTPSGGVEDNKTKVWRDDAGTMYLKDVDNTTKTLSDLITAGVTDHGVLTGLGDDDHSLYYTAGRHTNAHTASYNMALPIDETQEVNGNPTLGQHLSDEAIHWQREGRKVYVAKTGGQYANIQDAIDGIPDASQSKPYVIYVAPGIYTGTVILSKSYVSIVGIQPQGAQLIETQNSGAVIEYESTGVGDDLMTLWLKSGGSTDLKGITIANLTIKNTQTTEYGSMQAAVNIGRADPYPRAHEIMFKNCNLYGEINTVCIETGNPVFKDCYIEGENQVVHIQDDARFEETYFYCHSDDYSKNNLLIGKTGDVEIKAHFMGCTFDTKVNSQYVGVGEWSAANAISYFMSCRIMPPAWKASWEDGGHEGLIYLFDTNAIGWVDGYTYALKQYSINSKNLVAENGHVISYDADVSINFGSGGYLGDLYKFRAGVGYDEIPCYMPLEADYDQTDFGFKRYVLARAGDPVRASTGSLVEIEHKCDTDSSTNTAVLLRMKNTKGSGGFDYGAVGNVIEYDLDGVQKFVVNKDGDLRTSGTLFGSQGTKIGQVVTVAKSGGQFTTIQAAIDSITDASASKPYVVYVYPGVYDEQVTLKDYVSLYGASRMGTRIVHEDGAVTPPTDGYVVKVMQGCTVSNIYIENTYNSYASVAVWMYGPDALVVNCDIVSDSFDTFYAYRSDGGNVGRIENCNIEMTHTSVGADCFAVVACTIEVYDTMIRNDYASAIWVGSSAGAEVATSAKFYNCTIASGNAGMQGKDSATRVNTAYFTNCSFFNVAESALQTVFYNGSYGADTTVYLTACRYDDLGEPAATYVIREPDYYGDVGSFDSLNVDSSGAGTGEGKFSGDVDAPSFTIGANALTTTEWAHLDGQDQAVKTTDSPTFDDVTISDTILHEADANYSIYSTHRTVTTTDAAWHHLGGIFSYSTGESMLIIADITAVDSTGAHAAGYTVTALFKRLDGGTGTRVGVTTSVTFETDAAWDATIDKYEGSSYQSSVQVKGNNQTIRWCAHVKVIRAGSI